MEMWAVGVKQNGSRAVKFMIISVMNIEVKRSDIFWYIIFFCSVFISVLMKFINRLIVFVVLLLVFFNIFGINIIGMITESQFIFIEEVDGSNIENRLLIIFIYYIFCRFLGFGRFC